MPKFINTSTCNIKLLCSQLRCHQFCKACSRCSLYTYMLCCQTALNHGSGSLLLGYDYVVIFCSLVFVAGVHYMNSVLGICSMECSRSTNILVNTTVAITLIMINAMPAITTKDLQHPMWHISESSSWTSNYIRLTMQTLCNHVTMTITNLSQSSCHLLGMVQTTVVHILAILYYKNK
jgi:hypothetical protein